MGVRARGREKCVLCVRRKRRRDEINREEEKRQEELGAEGWLMQGGGSEGWGFDFSQRH